MFSRAQIVERVILLIAVIFICLDVLYWRT